MVKFFKILVVSCWLLSIGLISSCQEGGEAGDLFGQWRMSGSDSMYVSFSGAIVSLRNTHAAEVYGNFQHFGDSLFIQCRSIYGDKADTVNIEQYYGLKPFDNIRLRIDKLNSDDLVLSKEGQTWMFYKY